MLTIIYCIQQVPKTKDIL